jgi:hypothetical protein
LAKSEKNEYSVDLIWEVALPKPEPEKEKSVIETFIEEKQKEYQQMLDEAKRNPKLFPEPILNTEIPFDVPFSNQSTEFQDPKAFEAALLQIKLMLDLYRNKTLFFYFCLVVLFCACATEQRNTQVFQAMEKFEQNNRITAKYRTNEFTRLADSQQCKKVKEKVYIYLLVTGEAKAFRTINCDNGNSLGKEFYEEYGSWHSNNRPIISVQTIRCEAIKLKFQTSFTIRDNPTVSKRYEFFKKIEDNMETNVHYQEICLSADTLIIGYDEYDQPIYLYKY